MFKKLVVANVAFLAGLIFGASVSSFTLFYAVPSVTQNKEIINLTKDILKCYDNKEKGKTDERKQDEQ